MNLNAYRSTSPVDRPCRYFQGRELLQFSEAWRKADVDLGMSCSAEMDFRPAAVHRRQPGALCAWAYGAWQSQVHRLAPGAPSSFRRRTDLADPFAGAGALCLLNLRVLERVRKARCGESSPDWQAVLWWRHRIEVEECCQLQVRRPGAPDKVPASRHLVCAMPIGCPPGRPTRRGLLTQQPWRLLRGSS